MTVPFFPLLKWHVTYVVELDTELKNSHCYVISFSQHPSLSTDCDTRGGGGYHISVRVQAKDKFSCCI